MIIACAVWYALLLVFAAATSCRRHSGSDARGLCASWSQIPMAAIC
jgi:hypothetical protein